MTVPLPITTPGEWAEALAQRPPRPLDPGSLGRVVVVSAHPDDETLAVGGLMRAVHAAGGEVELVVATDGEAAFPELDSRGRADLRRVRRRELDDALRVLGLGSVRVHRLGMPDSALDADALAGTLAPCSTAPTRCSRPGRRIRTPTTPRPGGRPPPRPR
ncbi:PIG-L family deacetylase [Pseudonocardia sp.]|uniref:PIG-L deacetylase family protein n=1 Tax=Pseudonocardia sp. TaxID=60912 RepID=UPI00260DBBC1|nr:PIG-L family deacetylase [Pseudonocardia sp.]